MKTFDHVILAVHADQVLKLLGDANIEEENTFNSWKYSKSKTFLHTDSRVMPSEKKFGARGILVELQIIKLF